MSHPQETEVGGVTHYSLIKCVISGGPAHTVTGRTCSSEFMVANLSSVQYATFFIHIGEIFQVNQPKMLILIFEARDEQWRTGTNTTHPLLVRH